MSSKPKTAPLPATLQEAFPKATVPELLRMICMSVPAMCAVIDERPEEPILLERAAAMQGTTQDWHDIVGALVAALGKRFDWLRTVIIPALMEEKGVTMITVADVGKLTLRDDVWVSVISEKKDEAFVWFSDMGFPDLISRTINGSTLAAWARKRVKDGSELPPPELVKITPYTKSVLTRVSG